MPLISTFGTLAARAFGLTSGAQAFLVVEHHYSPAAGPSQAVSFAGASVGNFALVITTDSILAPPSGWTLVSTFNNPTSIKDQFVYSKILNAADKVANSATFAVNGAASTVMALFYSGVTAATAVSTNTAASGTTLPLSGFTKGVGSKIIMSWASDDYSSATFSAPVGMTVRIAPFLATLNAASAAADMQSAYYTNGATLTWTGFSGVNDQYGQLIELT